MPIITGAQPVNKARIYTARFDERVDLKAVKASLDDLGRRGGITERDELLLEHLLELNVLSLDQVRRLLWQEAAAKTAYIRLHHLSRYRLVDPARAPRAGMRAWGLAEGKVYSLGLGGRL